jgi:hypothetical protein
LRFNGLKMGLKKAVKCVFRTPGLYAGTWRAPFLLLPIIAVIPAATVAATEKITFQAKPAASYPNKQTSEQVTIAAEPFITDEQTKEAFGKLNPFRSGILPILVVIQNDSPSALRVEAIRFVYTLPDGSKVESTPAEELRYLKGAKQPSPGPSLPRLPGAGGKGPKNPLGEWEIEGRAFSARVIPPGQSASGFVYFQTSVTSAAASLTVSGLVNAVSGKDLFYFEIPLAGK